MELAGKHVVITGAASGIGRACATRVGAAPLIAGGLLEPAEVAEAVVAGLAEERFLILPHAEVARHIAFKGAAPERWLEGMRGLLRQARDQSPPA